MKIIDVTGFGNSGKTAISDYLNKQENEKNQSNSALEEITVSSKKSKRSILDEITFENYNYYLGFDKLK